MVDFQHAIFSTSFYYKEDLIYKQITKGFSAKKSLISFYLKVNSGNSISCLITDFQYIIKYTVRRSDFGLRAQLNVTPSDGTFVSGILILGQRHQLYSWRKKTFPPAQANCTETVFTNSKLYSLYLVELGKLTFFLSVGGPNLSEV